MALLMATQSNLRISFTLVEYSIKSQQIQQSGFLQGLADLRNRRAMLPYTRND
jgi:hypothetical protein